jgi:hypothetical protein
MILRSFGVEPHQHPPSPCRPSGLRRRPNIQWPWNGHLRAGIVAANRITASLYTDKQFDGWLQANADGAALVVKVLPR